MKRPSSRWVGILLLALSGCTTAGSVETSFDLTEFSISGPSTLASDTESISVVNIGEYPHTLVVTDSAGVVVAATDLIQSGEVVDIGLDLPPGTFSFTCRIVAQSGSGDLIDHFEEGMSTTVEVTG